MRPHTSTEGLRGRWDCLQGKFSILSRSDSSKSRRKKRINANSTAFILYFLKRFGLGGSFEIHSKSVPQLEVFFLFIRHVFCLLITNVVLKHICIEIYIRIETHFAVLIKLHVLYLLFLHSLFSISWQFHTMLSFLTISYENKFICFQFWL